MKKQRENILLFLVLTLAVALRFYNLWEIPFTHDEFSALFRTGYQSFAELIDKGVLPDFHPAGMQIFLHYYIQAFGSEAWIVKFPFLIAGVLSVFLIFKIGKEMFNAGSGLLAAAFLAVTQYFIFYSQIARPYGMGLFFGLLAFLYWRRIIFYSGRIRWIDYLGWIFAAAIGAYVHYYLLLTLVLLSLTGLFYIKKRILPLYILSGLIIAILYLPHLNIFLLQLSKGGVETWLNKPEPDFLLDFFNYFVHFSPIFLISLGVLIILGAIFTKRLIRGWWIGPILFLLSFFIGYVYSIKISAILQFSGLIFSLPMFLLSVSFLLNSRKGLFYISFFFILIAGTYSLFEEREHYKVLYRSPYKYLIKNAAKTISFSEKETLVLMDGEEHIMKYYIDRYPLDNQKVILLRGIDNLKSIELLLQNAGDTSAIFNDVLLGVFSQSPQELVPMVHHYFPHLSNRQSYYQGEYYHFSNKAAATEIYLKKLETDFTPGSFPATVEDQYVMSSSKGESRYIFNNKNEFGLMLEFPLIFRDFGKKNRILDVVAEVNANAALDKAQIISAIYLGDSIVEWRSSAIGEFFKQAGASFHAFHSEALNYGKYTDEMVLKVFIWNMGLEEFSVNDIKVGFREGNPKLYSLYTPIR